MNELVAFIISLLSFLTIFGQVLIVALIILLVFPKKKNSKISDIYTILKRNAPTLIFIIASSAALGSLFLSEVALLVPCKLCWWQRIFMYPAAVVSLIALVTNDKGAVKYLLSLSVIGGAIAVYHYIMQLFPNLLECSEEVAKCSTVQFAQFGYITIPIMSLTTFLLIIVTSLIILKK